jgi:hypothetical protein
MMEQDRRVQEKPTEPTPLILLIMYFKDLSKYYEEIGMNWEANLFEEGAEKLRRNLRLPPGKTVEKGKRQHNNGGSHNNNGSNSSHNRSSLESTSSNGSAV